jgi:hypothetical protein
MKIIKDTYNNEFGVLRKVNLIDTFDQIAQNLNIKRNKKSDIPNNMKKVEIPVVEFYDKEDKFYDRAFYTSENAFKRYKVIKKISKLSEFFEFRRMH